MVMFLVNMLELLIQQFVHVYEDLLYSAEDEGLWTIRYVLQTQSFAKIILWLPNCYIKLILNVFIHCMAACFVSLLVLYLVLYSILFSFAVR